MRYKAFGKTGLEVSELCLGTWGIGGAGWDQNPEETKMDAIRASFEQGVNIFDTAPAYNAGAAERILGETLEKMGVRKDVILSTKCGNDFVNGQYVHCGKRDHILAQCDASLRNLRTDYIDLYILHWPQDDATPEETLGAMMELKKAGKVRFLGLSNHSVAQMEEAAKYADIDFIQVQYSMLEREREVEMRYAEAHGMATMGYGVLGGGLLTGRYRELRTYETMDSRNRFYKFFREPGWSKAQKLLGVMDEISAARGGVPLSEIAVNWALQKSFLTTALFGTQHRARAIENCHALDWTLSDDEVAKLDQALEDFGI
mgnify:CR=1 FL=1